LQNRVQIRSIFTLCPLCWSFCRCLSDHDTKPVIALVVCSQQPIADRAKRQNQQQKGVGSISSKLGLSILSDDCLREKCTKGKGEFDEFDERCESGNRCRQKAGSSNQQDQ
jgi:hypothetical protein